MQRSLYFIPELEAYKGFFDYGWARAITPTTDNTPVAGPFFNLCVAWKAASCSRQLPFLMIEGMSSVANTMANTIPRFAAQFADAIHNTIHLRTFGQPLNATQDASIKRALQEIRAKLTSELEKDFGTHYGKQVWQNILTVSDVQLALWKSEESAYVTIYAAYEEFLTACMALKIGDPNYKWSNAEVFGDLITEKFGKQFCDAFWMEENTVISRLVRNAILHKGGKVVGRLKKCAGKIHVLEGGTVAIGADATTRLYSHFRDQVTGLIPQVLKVL